MTLDKLFKLVVILIVCLIAALFFYFSSRGAEETITRQEPDPERTATDDILGENIGITDSDNAGMIIESETYRPLVTQTLGDTNLQNPATDENPSAPAKLSPREQIHREIELERLRQVLEANLGDEMRTRELRRQAMGSPIGASQVDFAKSGLNGAHAQNLAQVDASVLPGISPSQQLTLDQLASNTSAQSAQRPAVPVPPQTQVSDPVGYTKHTRAPARSPYEIKKGTVIPGTLVTEINSDIPGNVVGMVRHDVFDTVTGQYLLIPNGSRLFGLYDPDISYAQRRINVLWTHLIFPDGDTLVLEDQQGSDVAGRTGFSDKRKGHFLTNLGGNLLYSILSTGETALQSRLEQKIIGPTSQDSALEDAIAGLGAQLGGGNQTAADQFNQKQAGRAPTLMIRSGYRFNILVSKDIILEPI